MSISEKAFMEQMKKKVEKELRDRETKSIEYWLGELTAVYDKRHQRIADIQVDLQNLMNKMKNRVAALNRGLD